MTITLYVVLPDSEDKIINIHTAMEWRTGLRGLERARWCVSGAVGPRAGVWFGMVAATTAFLTVCKNKDMYGFLCIRTH